MERPLACWKGEERYRGEVIPTLTIILKTGGCRHNRCRMCSYRFDRYATSASLPELLISQLDWVDHHYPLSGIAMVKIYTSGSFFDPEEVPPAVVREAARRFAGKLVVVETRPEFVDSDRIGAFTSAIDTGVHETPLTVAMGLETTSDAIREKSIDKGFTFDDFSSAVERARAGGAGIKAYLLHKPLFLTEAEAMADMQDSIRNIMDLVDRISMNPCTVQRLTELEFSWKRGEYRPPYLWSVLEILLSAPVMVSCDPVGGGRARGPHNCGTCDYEIVKAIRAYNLTEDRKDLWDVVGKGCRCREEWEYVVARERPYCMPLTR